MRKQKLEWMIPRRYKKKKDDKKMINIMEWREVRKKQRKNEKKSEEKDKGRNTRKIENLAENVKFISWR